MRLQWSGFFAAVTLSLTGCAADLPTDAGDPSVMLESVTLYASFDRSLHADFARGSKSLRARFGALDNPAGFRF